MAGEVLSLRIDQKDMTMRISRWFFAAVFCFLGGTAFGEDHPNPDQLKKAYDDALVQLKEAQNSKSVLAKENERLGKQIEDLKAQLAASQGQVEGLKRQVADNDQKTFSLRSNQAAWQSFMRAHPELLVKWRLFLGEDVLALPQEPGPWIQPCLPLFDAESGERS